MTFPNLIYKIVDREQWTKAQQAGSFAGAEIDLRDGYIHFSTASQVRETAAKHFTGQANLLLVSVDATGLGNALQWEPSRGGDLFPHLYAELDFSIAKFVLEIPLDAAGIPQIPKLPDE